MGRYCAGNAPAKTARHFSQLLDSNTIQRGLRRSGYVTFWLRDQIAFWPCNANFQARYTVSLDPRGQTPFHHR